MAARKADLAVRIGRNLRRYREAIEPEMTQRRLAKLMNELGDEAVDAQAISDWERGVRKPSDRYLPALVKALGLTDASALYADPKAEADAEQSQLDQIVAEQQDMRAIMNRILALLEAGTPQAPAADADQSA